MTMRLELDDDVPDAQNESWIEDEIQRELEALTPADYEESKDEPDSVEDELQDDLQAEVTIKFI